MRSLLEAPVRRGDDVSVVFARSARIALAGLLAAPALLGAASAAGCPLRAASGPVYWLSALAGFGGAGWFAGSSLGLEPRRRAALGGAFLAVGALVAPSFHGLQDLTGREPLPAVAAATLLPFTAAFALGGVLAGRTLGISRLGAAGLLACAAGGLMGGAFALLPFLWAWTRIELPGGSYVAMGLAIVGFLGCLIAPCRVVGITLGRAWDAKGLAGT